MLRKPTREREWPVLPISDREQEQLGGSLTQAITSPSGVRHLKKEWKNCQDSPLWKRQLICFLNYSWIWQYMTQTLKERLLNTEIYLFLRFRSQASWLLKRLLFRYWCSGVIHVKAIYLHQRCSSKEDVTSTAWMIHSHLSALLSC